MSEFEQAATETGAGTGVDTSLPQSQETQAPAGGGEEGLGQQEQQTASYTPDELGAADFDWSAADRNRLPEGIRKNLARIESESGRRVKAESERQMEERLRSLENNARQKPQSDKPMPGESIEQFVNRTPDAAEMEINAYIKQLDQQISNPNATLEEKEMARFQRDQAIYWKAEIPNIKMKRLDQNQQMGNIYRAAENAVLAQVPDYNVRAPEIEKYLAEEFKDFGFTPTQMRHMVDPALWYQVAKVTGNPELGVIGPMLQLIANKLYERGNAGKKIAAKQVRTAHNTMEPGAARPTSSGGSVKNMSDSAFDDYLARLKNG